jgi:hypothetical protein
VLPYTEYKKLTKELRNTKRKRSRKGGKREAH